MKKIKLLIALCLSVLCIGAVTANAAMTTTMADEVALFENLGFNLPETAAETDFVTRGQFVGTLTQYINTEFAAGGEYSFEDVPKDDALSGALNYAVAMGIVSDDTVFNPDNNVTYPQAMKMAVAFLGRSVEAESLGGYDGGGYNAIASTYKLYAGLQDMSGEFVTVRDFYKILYNVGNAKMLVRDQYGSLYTGKTPFEEYFNMYQVRGVVTANENTSLNDNYVTMPTDVIALNEDMYRYEGDAPLGYSVEGWASYESGNMPKIVMLKEYKNNVTELSLVGLDARVDGNYFYYEDGGKESKVKIDNPYIIYNDIAAPTMRMNDVLNCKLGTITFIDYDDDQHADVISIKEYRPVVVSVTSKMSMRIVDKNGAPAVLLDNDGKVKGYKIIKDGKEIDIQDLVADDLLAVYESRTKSYVTIEVSADVVSGIVTSHNSVARQMKIGDTVYNLSDYFNTYYMSRIAYNQNIDIAATPDGVLHAITTAKASANKYGVILRWWNDKDTEDFMIRIATEDGVKNVTVSDKVKLDGQSATESAMKTRLSTLRDRGKANLLVKYDLNDDGTVINVIDTYDQLTANTAPQNFLTGAEDPDNDMKEWNFPHAENNSPAAGNMFYNSDSGAGGWAPYISSMGKIYAISTGADVEDEDVFVVKNSAYIKEVRDGVGLNRNRDGFANRNYRIFNVDKFGNAEAVVFIQDRVSTVIGENDSRGIVYRISKATNLDGEITYELVVYTAGNYYTHFLSEDYYTEIVESNSGLPFANGDYIAYKVDITDEIVKCELIYDRDERELLGDLTTPNYLSLNKIAYLTGWIYDIDGRNISIIPSGWFNPRLTADNIETFDPASDALVGLPIGSAPLNMISADGKTIAEGSMGDVTTFIQSPEDAQFVILRLGSGVLKEVILYN